MRSKYVPGDHWVRCDRTGFKVLASLTRKTWDGLIVRNESWEPRQPQDFVRGRKDDQAVQNPRSDIDPYFLSDGEVTVDDL